MDERHERALARVRAVLLAGLVLSLAAGAHVLGGGALPAPLVLLLLTSVTLAAASALGRRRLRLRTLVPALALGQVALHSAFAVLAVPTATGQVPAGHVHGGVLVGTVSTGAAHASTDLASPLMLAAHAVATLVTALAAVHADRAWARAVAWLVRLFPGLAVLLHLPVLGRRPGVRATPRRRLPAGLADVVATRPHRGPPVAAAAA
ncbi:hypothetical protein [Pseudokineococcus sp. 1T1Z-3]|uniref:hypothetical protein n=1 Tax=Pseudokineococcus sp. 1T1Z-3 TaxID=3132745 RepID=UPI0030AC933A